MSAFINVMEELVVKSAREQVSYLWADEQQRVKLPEIVAFALNRLPPLYVTTQYGWFLQRNYARSKFGDKIFDTVCRAVRAVQFGDPLHDNTPLPESEMNSGARVLVKLSKMLGKECLLWRDVPNAVVDALYKRTGDTSLENLMLKGDRNPVLSPVQRHTILDVKSYLQRSRQRDRRCQALRLDTVDRTQYSDRLVMDYRELESYTLKAQLGYSNVLENLVVLVARHLLRNVPPSIVEQLDMAEVAAYALNRLPPLYATSDRGYQLLSQRAQSELSQEITAQVREAILKVGLSPALTNLPLTLNKFDREQEVALVELQQILERSDITWQNVAEIVENALRKPERSKIAA
ncbi:late competence development ComFB family protein [Pseudanabaena sp. PCC 6802]|uniref:late competence development ComFB family protein n=1 Tax=Pseudanabaena sp. PCC 6802 TaxID=118173 RepID=UPI00034A61CB|nr:late competence development ComFB family protein [Pseudanabaena sp. PCC 6802]